MTTKRYGDNMNDEVWIRARRTKKYPAEYVVVGERSEPWWVRTVEENVVDSPPVPPEWAHVLPEAEWLAEGHAVNNRTDLEWRQPDKDVWRRDRCRSEFVIARERADDRDTLTPAERLTERWIAGFRVLLGR